MITFATDLATARTLAAQSGKLVLAIWCADGCSACDQTINLWGDPSLQPFIVQNFVPYRGPQIKIPASAGDSWVPYAKGIKTLSCPLVCIIKPNQADGQYLIRWFGFAVRANFMIFANRALALGKFHA